MSFPPGDEMWMLGPLLTCESPIEEAFLEAVVNRAIVRSLTAVVLTGDTAYPVTPNFASEHLLAVHCQFKWKYRFDFVLELRNRSEMSSGLLVVECDGHDYHERSKLQAKRDRERDRVVQEAGASIFRFTGSEIHHDATGCADQCIAFIEAKLVNVEQEARGSEATHPNDQA